jgi:insertion element IS1 protein InsB
LDKVETGLLEDLDVHISYSVEMDEFWSFACTLRSTRVGNKKNRRWTWYAIDRKSGVLVAWQNGKRDNATCKKILEKMEHFPIRSYSTDNWDSYTSLLSTEKHFIGKANTWKILVLCTKYAVERKNLNFRTHLKRLCRKTICFSKNEEVHDKLIGIYIEKHYYKTGRYLNSIQLN